MKYLLSFCVALSLTISSYAGAPTTINNSFSISSNPVAEGQEVVFSYTGSTDAMNCGNTSFTYLFPGATLIDGNPVQFSTAPFNVQDITVSYPAAGNYTINHRVVASCSVSPSTATAVITVLPAAPIPTLGQWALIILSISLVIFGINAVKKSSVAITHG